MYVQIVNAKQNMIQFQISYGSNYRIELMTETDFEMQHSGISNQYDKPYDKKIINLYDVIIILLFYPIT